MTWIPGRTGKVIELLQPTVEQVDFDDIAWSLAHTNRYAGHGQVPVSVGLHTLIGLDLAPPPLRPLWLLHDAAESRIGELTFPAKEALFAIGDEVAPGTVRATWREFGRRHDNVIHAAAGLRLPSDAQKDAIKAIDLRALATEHRDFHQPSERPWAHELAGIEPDKRAHKWRAPDRFADQLLAAFRRYLPALAAEQRTREQLLADA